MLVRKPLSEIKPRVYGTISNWMRLGGKREEIVCHESLQFEEKCQPR